MSKRIEQLINDYPSIMREKALLANQIKNFRGITEVEMIESMVLHHPQGDRVQSSVVSEKTASVAISFSSRIKEMNDEWIKTLEIEYFLISEELAFFKSAIESLKPDLSEFMIDLIINRLRWDELIVKYHVSKTMVAKKRKMGISILHDLYEVQNNKIIINFLR